MQSSRWILALTAMCLVAVLPARADEAVDAQLRQMQERMQQLEDRLLATSEQLEQASQRVDEQQEIISKAKLADETAAVSGMASFFDSIEFSGLVDVSYIHNFNNPAPYNNLGSGVEGTQIGGNGGGFNSGNDSFTHALDRDPESFNFDMLLFTMEKPVSTESRAGFFAQIMYGKEAAFLNNGEQGHDPYANDEDFEISQAYIQYVIPIGDITMKAGKFDTLIGYETKIAAYNLNRSRGVVWNLLQPIDHNGVLFEKTTDGGIDLAFGVVNGAYRSTGSDGADINDGKSITGRVGMTEDTWSAHANFIWGDEYAGRSGDYSGIADLVVTFDPMEDLHLWFNGDYAWAEAHSVPGPNGPDSNGWGLAGGGRLALTDRLGFAARGEYAQESNNYFGHFASSPYRDSPDLEIWTLTGTFDYALTNNLTMRSEIEYAKADNQHGASPNRDIFPDDDSSDFDDDQLTIGAELTYEF